MFYILELPVARILEHYVNFAAHLPESIVGYANAARLGDAFQSRRNVDAIAENITVLNDDVADVNADADFNTPLGRDALVAQCLPLAERAEASAHAELNVVQPDAPARYVGLSKSSARHAYRLPPPRGQNGGIARLRSAVRKCFT